MIRRGFWLAVGATAGIMGYRRAASLGRSLSGTLMLDREADAERGRVAGAKPTASRKRQVARGVTRRTIRLTREVRRFNRDVREGMGLYLVRHPAQPSPTLGTVSTRGDDPPEPPEGAPDGKNRRRIGRADNDNDERVADNDNDERVKDDR